MTTTLRALCGAALCLLVACGGGEPDAAPQAETTTANTAPQQPGLRDLKLPPQPNRLTGAIPVSVIVDHYEEHDDDHCGKKLDLTASSSVAVAEQMIQFKIANCGSPTPKSSRPVAVPLADIFRFVVVGGDAMYTWLEVEWIEGVFSSVYGGKAYGTMMCPDGYRPTEQEIFDGTNAGLYPLSDVVECIPKSSYHFPEADLGVSDACVGDPINPSTGNNFQVETDFRASGFGAFVERTYNSQDKNSGLFGSNWTSGFDRKIIFPDQGSPAGAVKVVRPNGQRLTFEEGRDGSPNFTPITFTRDQLRRVKDTDGNVSGYEYTTDDDSVEAYDLKGRLLSVRARSGLKLTLHYKAGNKLDYAEDTFGQRITFMVGSDGRVSQIKDPAQRIYKYFYDGVGNLEAIEYPGQKVLTHIYGELEFTSGVHQPHALTGIKDEQNIRFATITYDKQGWAKASEHALGTERTDLTYTKDSNGAASSTVVVTDGSKPATYTSSVRQSAAQVSEVSRPCPGNPSVRKTLWRYPGQLESVEYFSGDSRSSLFDERGNEYLRRDSLLDEGRTIDTNIEWDPRWRLPTKITRENMVLDATYDPDNGGLTSQTITDTSKGTTRKWTYTPDAYGRVEVVDGPRTDVDDVTRFTYYPAGQTFAGELKTIVNPLGHTTTFTSYDKLGNLLEYKDANDQITQLRYDLRYRLKRIIRNGQEVSLDYYDVGLLKSVSHLPSGRVTSYLYDDGRRLTDIYRGDGSRVHYTISIDGKTQKTEVFDKNDKLSMTSDATFDDLYRLASFTDARKHKTKFTPDANGNLGQIDGPLGLLKKFDHDGLNRLKTITASDSGTITLKSDVADHVWSVIDANNRESKEDLDVLGNAHSRTLPAPDGAIASQTPDAAGNVETKVDFRGITETRTHDALNRITSRTTAGSPSISYTYDEGANAKGHLSGMTDESGTYVFGYDADGRVTSASRTIDGRAISASFGYSNGNFTSVTYPSGRVVSYGYVSDYLRTAKVDGVVLAKMVTQHPRGSVSGWTWASGAIYKRTRNKDGLVATYNLGAATQTLGYNDLNLLESITDSNNSLYNQSFSHDLAGRVTSYTGVNAKGQANQSEVYEYDDNGNRTIHTTSNIPVSYFYQQGTNFLQTVQFPSARNWEWSDGYTLTDGKNRFRVDDFGRVRGVSNSSGATDYLVNGFDQRVTKVTSSGAKTHYVFGPRGELLAELDGSGQTLKEYIWLPTDDDGFPTLIGVSSGQGGAVNYVFSDHLGTPRLVTKPNGDVLWRWVSDPFGGGAPVESGMKLNVRFAGQYFDAEHGYHYNWHRYYDPATGRYITSDPEGVAGGINTYLYAGGNPLKFVDPTGKNPILVPIVWLAEALGISVETLMVGGVVTAEVAAGLATGAQGPLAGPIAGAGATVRNVEQYSLRVIKSGFYPVMQRGAKDPVAITWCERGDVWKFGKTRNPSTRYSTTYLRSIGEHGVEYVKEFESPSGTEALAVELKKIVNYMDQYDALPPGNKVRR